MLDKLAARDCQQLSYLIFVLARAYRCKAYEQHHARQCPENLLLF